MLGCNKNQFMAFNCGVLLFSVFFFRMRKHITFANAHAERAAVCNVCDGQRGTEIEGGREKELERDCKMRDNAVCQSANLSNKLLGIMYCARSRLMK